MTTSDETVLGVDRCSSGHHDGYRCSRKISISEQIREIYIYGIFIIFNETVEMKLVHSDEIQNMRLVRLRYLHL